MTTAYKIAYKMIVRLARGAWPFKLSKRVVVLLLISPILAVGLYRVYKDFRTNEIRAVDHLLIEYDGGGPTFPIFTVDDFKPGDCAYETVAIEHLQEEKVQISIRSLVTLDENNLSEVLSFQISENSTPIYGTSSPTDYKSLKDFFDESNSQYPLSIYNGVETKSFDFQVCFEKSTGNDYQEKSVIFDLLFFEELPPIELPEECAFLTGIITEVIYGTDGNDRIHGTTASELIYGYAGNDRIDPSSGSDCVVAGPGNDRVENTTGNEVILGGPGNDKLKGGSGNDTIYGGSGNDKIWGGSDNDVIYGGSGKDRIKGGSGIDELYGNTDNDKIWGGSNNDYLNGGADFDKLDGDSGTDTCVNGEILDSCEL